MAKLAFELFREWTKNAKLKYKENNFTIIDERVLIQDTVYGVNNALESLLKEELAEKRGLVGYDYGYITGYIGGYLNQHWFYEYIVKNTDEYKCFIANSSIIAYLEFEEMERIKLNSIYKGLLRQEINLEQIDFAIDYTRCDKLVITEIGDEKPTTNCPILMYLYNQRSRQMLNFIDEDSPDFLPDAQCFITEQMVTDLIDTAKSSNSNQDIITF
jgi:hypothetical protein